MRTFPTRAPRSLDDTRPLRIGLVAPPVVPLPPPTYAGTERVVVKNKQMVIVNAMTVTLSTDHRCVDGALGAELLGAFKRYIENPMGMLV